MSVLLAALSQGTLGIHPRSIVVRVRNSGADAIVAGDLIRFDFTQASAEPGQGDAAPSAASTSKFANVTRATAAAAANTLGGLYGVAMAPIGLGKIGDVLVCGVATVKAVSGTYTQGEVVGLPATGGTAGAVTRASVQLKIGTVLSTTGGSATSVQILLDGTVAKA